jgi:hypothetical protein
VRGLRLRCVIVIVVAIAMGASPAAGEQTRRERVAFESGAASTTLKGSVAGYDTVDYVLGAREGQTMNVNMQTDNSANYFNVLPPKSEAAIAIGSTLGNEWTGTLPVDGDYTVRVYLMRSAARRNEKATYTLTVGITGRPDAMVAGTPDHATGIVRCSVGTDPKGSSQCSFGVIRGTPGNAEVRLASPGFDVKVHKDRLRALTFAGDNVTSTNSSETVKAEKHGDTWSISVDDFYFYEIPEAVIVGG